MAHKLPLGATQSGKDWCLKALHPSDPTNDIRGIPDESSVPSAFLNYQSTFSIKPATGATGTWSFEGSLIPHPVNFLHIQQTDSTGVTNTEFFNTQLNSDTATEAMGEFLRIARRWRLAYMSVTVYQDGADLANQGTMVASQVPCQPQMLTASVPIDSGEDLQAAVPVAAFFQSDRPDFDTMQAMPNAYFGRSREGLYMPLRLTKTCQEWHGPHDMMFVLHDLLADDTDAVVGWVAVPPSTATGAWPFMNIEAVSYNQGTDSVGGQATSCLCNDVVGNFAARNVSVSTGFTFFVRAGFEVQVVPKSTYSTSLKLSPVHDSMAIDTYFAISRELKDAYPADFNDLGKIWDVISSVAKTVAPALNAIPGIGNLLSMGVSGVATAGDAIRKAVAKKGAFEAVVKAGRNASLAQVERAKKAIARGQTAPGSGRRRRGKPGKAKPKAKQDLLL